MTAYITALGRFLPGPPVDNESMEDFLGRIGGKASRARQRVLKQNGIVSRHYAIDRQQRSLYSNAEMASLAVKDALTRTGADGFDFLAAATSQGDHPLPGFASFVHAELGGPPCEIATHHGVCASGVAALQHAALQVESRRRERAVACASEFASRLLKASRYEAQHGENGRALSFDAEFLRWMLSDGAGAAVLEPNAAPDRLSLLGRMDRDQVVREPVSAVHVRRSRRQRAAAVEIVARLRRLPPGRRRRRHQPASGHSTARPGGQVRG
jgi:3-oxoacyl-[acyl-carrier-protein] synthase-3